MKTEYRNMFHMPKNMKCFLCLAQCGQTFLQPWKNAMITFRTLRRQGTLARDIGGTT